MTNKKPQFSSPLMTYTSMFIATLALAACGSHERHDDDADDPEHTPSPTDTSFRSSLATSTLVDSNSDTASIVHEITACSGGSAPLVISSPVEDQTIPGTGSGLEDNPLDSGSSHPFAAMFQVLEPGCYDLVVRPIQADGTASAVCAPAHRNGIQLTSGQTTQVQLLMQCSHTDNGALEAIAALNHPPLITDIRFEDSLFVCGDVGGVCVTATDSDDDPLDIVLNAGSACSVSSATSRTGSASSEGIETCFDVSCAADGRHDMLAQAFDMLRDDAGSLVRVEDWLTNAGYPSTSRSELAFPTYFDCTSQGGDGMMLFDDFDGEQSGSVAPLGYTFAGLAKGPTQHTTGPSSLLLGSRYNNTRSDWNWYTAAIPQHDFSDPEIAMAGGFVFEVELVDTAVIPPNGVVTLGVGLDMPTDLSGFLAQNSSDLYVELLANGDAALKRLVGGVWELAEVVPTGVTLENIQTAALHVQTTGFGAGEPASLTLTVNGADVPGATDIPFVWDGGPNHVFVQGQGGNAVNGGGVNYLEIDAISVTVAGI